MVADTRILAHRYKLDRKIAAGAMGTVYVAIDETLHRKVAIKLMNEALAGDETFIERFRREARSAAGLTHPNIAGVFDYGQDEGSHFIVMEYVPGKNLARVLREDGPLSPARASAFALQIAQALGLAHDSGLVHRDVKPANIIVGASGKVKVTDFGIARATSDTTLTATGSVLGTAQYLSPEQAGGGHIGPETDVYALGIVLYEMLTGSVPFTGESAVAVAMRHVNEKVPSPRSLNPKIPSELDAVVLKATASDAADRYSDGTSFAQALRGAAVGTPVAAVSAAPTLVGTKLHEQPPPALGDRWDAAKVGRTVVAVFAGLVALAVLLGFIRAIQTSDGTREAPVERQADPAGDEPTTPAPEEPVRITIPDDIVGRPATEVTDELVALGFVVEEDRVPDDAEPGTVLDSSPAPGDALEEGKTVNLVVSDGPGEDDEDDEGPPGKAKGHGKKEKDD